MLRQVGAIVPRPLTRSLRQNQLHSLDFTLPPSFGVIERRAFEPRQRSIGSRVPLFDRISRDIRLTPAGTTLLQYVRHIEAISNAAVAALAPFGGQEGIEISIGASHTIAVYLLPKLLLPLLGNWPKLRIHIVGGSTNEILHALTVHQIGVGLIEAPAFRPDLKIEIFGEDDLTLIVRPDHRWAEKTELRAAELVQEPIMLREVGSGMRKFVEEKVLRSTNLCHGRQGSRLDSAYRRALD